MNVAIANRRGVIRGLRWNLIMPSPFPGIDPYLESQHFWEDFHPSFPLVELLPSTSRGYSLPHTNEDDTPG